MVLKVDEGGGEESFGCKLFFEQQKFGDMEDLKDVYGDSNVVPRGDV